MKITNKQIKKYLDRWVAGDHFSKEEIEVLKRILWEVYEIVDVSLDD